MISTSRCICLTSVLCLLIFALSFLKISIYLSKNVIRIDIPALKNNTFEANAISNYLCLNTTIKELWNNKTKKQVNKIIHKFPERLAVVLRPRILKTITQIYNSKACSAFILNDTEIRSKTFLNLLENITASTLEDLSVEVAGNYTSHLDMKAVSRNILPDEIVKEKTINKFTYYYVYNPISICRNKEVHLLVIIKSFVGHYRSRQVLRKTWIRELSDKEKNTVVVFSLGYSHRERFMIEDENLIYKDIIQGSFIDTYRNNTMKIMMEFDWATQYCGNAQYVFFVDDDLIVNVKSTINFLSSVPKEIEENLYSGMQVVGGLPDRNKASRWFIDEKSYPYPVYPEYIAGCAMFMSQNVVKRMQSVFPFVKYIPFDDVYIGIIAKTLRIPIHDNELLTKVNIRNLKTINKAIANHGFQDEEFLYHTYEKLMKN